MEIIEIQTLVDITNTRAIRPSHGSQLAIDQNRNFITLMQCVELRSIVSYDTRPVSDKVDIKSMGFGSAYKGKHQVWTFRFAPDRSGVYEEISGDGIGNLINDLHEVPVIKNLDETINIGKSIFNCKDGLSKNTVIKLLQSTI